MAANREVVQRRTFAKGFIRNFSVFLDSSNRTLFQDCRCTPRQSRKGISEIEGKVARVATSERGTRSEFQTAAPYRATIKAFHDLRLDARTLVPLLSCRQK